MSVLPPSSVSMIPMTMLSPSKMMSVNCTFSPIPNVYMKPADLFPIACKFKRILCTAGNKKCLQALIKSHQLSELSKSISQELVYSVGEDCVSLSTGDTKESLSFSQGEADTIMLSVYAALRTISPGYSNLIVIDAEDTDVYIPAAAISHDIPGIIIPLRSSFCFCRGICTEYFSKSHTFSCLDWL